MTTTTPTSPHAEHPQTLPDFKTGTKDTTTTIFPRADQPPTLPDLKLGAKDLDATTKETSKPVASSSSSSSGDGDQYKRLTHKEWVRFCRGIGVLKDEESEMVYRPTSTFWPPKGFPDGLYQDTLVEKSKFTYWFHVLSTLRWMLMILQLATSAVLTALGSVPGNNKTAITVIASISTCIAGILALMHNSGLPDRYRSDRNEFWKLEEYMKLIIDTRLINADQTADEAMAECFKKFGDAKQTVQNNVPASYTSTQTPAISKKTKVELK